MIAVRAFGVSSFLRMSTARRLGLDIQDAFCPVPQGVSAASNDQKISTSSRRRRLKHDSRTRSVGKPAPAGKPPAASFFQEVSSADPSIHLFWSRAASSSVQRAWHPQARCQIGGVLVRSSSVRCRAQASVTMLLEPYIMNIFVLAEPPKPSACG